MKDEDKILLKSILNLFNQFTSSKTSAKLIVKKYEFVKITYKYEEQTHIAYVVNNDVFVSSIPKTSLGKKIHLVTNKVITAGTVAKKLFSKFFKK
jgi:hypothetical protein